MNLIYIADLSDQLIVNLLYDLYLYVIRWFALWLMIMLNIVNDVRIFYPMMHAVWAIQLPSGG